MLFRSCPRSGRPVSRSAGGHSWWFLLQGLCSKTEKGPCRPGFPGGRGLFWLTAVWRVWVYWAGFAGDRAGGVPLAWINSYLSYGSIVAWGEWGVHLRFGEEGYYKAKQNKEETRDPVFPFSISPVLQQRYSEALKSFLLGCFSVNHFIVFVLRYI